MSTFATFRLAACCLAACLGIGLTAAAWPDEPKVLVGHTDPVYAAAYTPDGKQLITGAFDRTLRLWDLNSLTTLRTMPGHTGLVLCVALSKDGQRVASGSLDNSVRLWDVPQSVPTAHWQAHGGAAAVAVAPPGRPRARLPRRANPAGPDRRARGDPPLLHPRRARCDRRHGASARGES